MPSTFAPRQACVSPRFVDPIGEETVDDVVGRATAGRLGIEPNLVGKIIPEFFDRVVLY
jgi:hypothetical protein